MVRLKEDKTAEMNRKTWPTLILHASRKYPNLLSNAIKSVRRTEVPVKEEVDGAQLPVFKIACIKGERGR